MSEIKSVVHTNFEAVAFKRPYFTYKLNTLVKKKKKKKRKIQWLIVFWGLTSSLHPHPVLSPSLKLSLYMLPGYCCKKK